MVFPTFTLTHADHHKWSLHHPDRTYMIIPNRRSIAKFLKLPAIMAILGYGSLAAICAFLTFTHYYIHPYFSTYKSLRKVPGPWLAKFSNIWLAFGARQGKKFAWVHWAHEKYGPVVRVGYNHVSIAEPEGLHAVYAHGNGFLKE